MVEIQKKFKSFNSTQKAHGVQKMSIFHWKMNSQRKVELGAEYPSDPLYQNMIKNSSGEKNIQI